MSKWFYNLITTLNVFGAVFFSACSEKKSSPKSTETAKSEISESLELSEELELALTIEKNDEILTIAFMADGRLAASTKAGASFVINPEDQGIEKVSPYFKFDMQATTLLTVSKEYLWVIALHDGTIGRNKQPPDQNNKFEISKVTVSDIFDVAAATPIAASEEQLFMVSDDSLVVLTFSGTFINRKMVPFPNGKLAKGEYVLGAGPMGTASSTANYWVMTNKRLLRFNSDTWIEKELILRTGERTSSLVALGFDKVDQEKADRAFGLLDGKDVVGLISGELETAAKDVKAENTSADAKKMKKVVEDEE